MKNEIKINIPSMNNLEDINNKITNGVYKDVNLIIKDDDNKIIYYFIIIDYRIEGCDELIYDFGTLNLFDSEYHYMYLASLDDNIKFCAKEEDDAKLIKKNEL